MIFLLSLAFADVPEYTYLEVGMEAPFSGRLFNDDASQLLADQIANATDRCQIEMDYQIGMVLAKKNDEIQELKSQHKYDKGVLAAKIETQQKRIEELEELKTPSKKELWFSLGLVSGVALTISIAKAVQ
jgi:precorrin-2 methylase